MEGIDRRGRIFPRPVWYNRLTFGLKEQLAMHRLLERFRKFSRIILVFATLAVFLLVFPPTRIRAEAQGQTKYILGVVPFLNVTKNPDYDWLSVGIAETLTNRLSAVKAVRMVERIRLNEVLTEQKLGLSGFVDAETAARVGKILGANRLIIGSYQILKNDLLIQARMVNVETGVTTEPFEAEGPKDDVLKRHYAVLCNRAIEILGDIALTPIEIKKLTTPETKEITAYELNSKALIIMTGNPEGGKAKRFVAPGELVKAIDYLKKATEIDPNYALAYWNWAKALDGLERYNEAIAKWKKYTELEPREPEPYYWWARSLISLHKHEEAIAKMKKAIEVDPNFAVGYAGWGLILGSASVGRDEEALIRFRQALQIDSDCALAYFGWGLLLLRRNEIDEAREKFRKARKLGYDVPLKYLTF